MVYKINRGLKILMKEAIFLSLNAVLVSKPAAQTDAVLAEIIIHLWGSEESRFAAPCGK